MVTKISGKKSSTGIHHLSVDNKEITTIPDALSQSIPDLGLLIY